MKIYSVRALTYSNDDSGLKEKLIEKLCHYVAETSIFANFYKFFNHQRADIEPIHLKIYLVIAVTYSNDDRGLKEKSIEKSCHNVAETSLFANFRKFFNHQRADIGSIRMKI